MSAVDLPPRPVVSSTSLAASEEDSQYTTSESQPSSRTTPRSSPTGSTSSARRSFSDYEPLADPSEVGADDHDRAGSPIGRPAGVAGVPARTSPGMPFTGVPIGDPGDPLGASTLAFRIIVDIFEEGRDPRAAIVKIGPMDTVEQLKEKIQLSEHIPIDRQRIVHAGEQLDNRRHVTFDPNASASSVGDGYQIRPGDTCTLVVLPVSSSSRQAHPASSSSSSSSSSKPGTTATSAGGMASGGGGGSSGGGSGGGASLRRRRRPRREGLRVRSRPTVTQILGGVLTPAWASTRGKRPGLLSNGPARKPSASFRPVGYHPFGEKSDNSFMKSSMVNGGLHPYLFDRQRKIPRVYHARPRTAQTVPLARALGLPENQVEWSAAVTHQFRAMFFQLNRREQAAVLRDLVVHGGGVVDTSEGSAGGQEHGVHSQSASTSSSLRSAGSGHSRARSAGPGRPSSSQGGGRRHRGIDSGASDECSEDRDTSGAESGPLVPGIVSGGGAGTRYRSSQRLRMSERDALMKRMYRVERVSEERRQQLEQLRAAHATLKQNSRLHVAAVKVQLTQTQAELRERVNREMQGALLDPSEVREMMSERRLFQDQIATLEMQIKDIGARVHKRHGPSSSSSGASSAEDELKSRLEASEARCRALEARVASHVVPDNAAAASASQPSAVALGSIEGEIAHLQHQENEKKKKSAGPTASIHVDQKRSQTPEKNAERPASGRVVTPPSLPATARSHSDPHSASESGLTRSHSHPDLQLSTSNERLDANSIDGTRAGGSSDRSHRSRDDDSARRSFDRESGYDTDEIASTITKLRSRVEKKISAVVPGLEDATEHLQRFDSRGEDFREWARCFDSDGSRAGEFAERTTRHLLKAVASLARCDGLSGKAVSAPMCTVCMSLPCSSVQ